MGSRAAGPGTPVTDQQRIRYQDCINRSAFDAPPFACMVRDHGTASGAVDDIYFAGTRLDDNYIINVGRCDEAAESRQRPDDWVFNGPEVLKAGSMGRCTEDFPARALHLHSDVLHRKPSTPAMSGLFVGPQRGSWLLWDSGHAFRWLGETERLGSGDNQYEIGTVRPAYQPPYIGAQFAGAPQSVPYLNSIGQDPSYPWVANVAVPYSSLMEYANDSTAATAGIKFLLGGIYEFHFHCTLTSPDAPQGSSLTLKAYLDDDALNYGYRTQQVEIDNYGNEVNRSAENVAFSSPLFVEADQVLNIRNISAYAVSCSAIYISIRRVWQ